MRWPTRRVSRLRAKPEKIIVDLPKPETYGLAVPMRRAAVSIPANIAGGFRRRGQADKARFMNLAEGSIEECRYYLILAKDLGYGDTTILNSLLEEVSLRDSDFWLLTSVFHIPKGYQGRSPCRVSRSLRGADPDYRNRRPRK